MSDAPRPRVLLADDFPALLVAWRRLLTHAYEIVGEVSDGRAILDAVATLRPDVVVVDQSMPGMSGLDATIAIREAIPQTRIVLVTASPDPELADAAMRAGASAFVLKQAAATDLPRAIDLAMAGQTFCTPFVRD